jgi:hypothetical protein
LELYRTLGGDEEIMKGNLHKKVDRIKITQDYNSFPLWKIKSSDFDWMKETIIRLEKENEELKKFKNQWEW